MKCWCILHVFYLVGALTSHYGIVSSAEERRCQFPRSWKGKWYQSGLGEVVIREKLISKKGYCVEHQRDYYLVRNRDENCYQCLLMMDRHKNIIQYKESYCVPKDSLRSICAQIQVEKPLYTLVREPAIPTKCPFKDAFYFDYNDQASGFCDNKLSYAKPCAGHTKYQLHFEHCKEYVMFHNKDLDFGCVASWKDGSETYMYAQFSGQGIATKDQSYRCFKYQHYGNVMNMAMSVDATCQGLRTPQDGPVTMQFSKDIFGWPPPSCNYPDWLTDVTWRDIDGRHTFSFVADSRVMTGFYRKRMNNNPEVQSEHRCKQVMEDKTVGGDKVATVFSFTTHRCMTKHQCLKFKRNREGKVQFYQGDMGDYESGEVCLDDSEYGNHQIIMEENRQAVDCPLKGSYLMQDREGCHQRISIGCSNSSLLTFTSTCNDDQQVNHEMSLQCILTWEDGGRTYLVTREPGVESRTVNCFSFKERHNTIQYTTEHKCGTGSSGMMDKSIKYELLQRETCEEAVQHDILPIPPGPTSSTISTTTRPHINEDYHYDDLEDANIAPISNITPEPNIRDDSQRRDRENRRRDRDKQRDRQRDRGRDDEDGDEWLALSEDDILPPTRDTSKDNKTEVREKPYPKYSQVDQPKVVAPTRGTTRGHHTSSADVLHTNICHLVLHIATILSLYLST